MKLRYYAEADVGVDHRRTLDLLASITEKHAIPVEVVQVEPKRDPPSDFPGEVEHRDLSAAWDDFTYNSTLQEGLGGAPSKLYNGREDIIGNVGIVVDGTLVWATRFWGTHHGWGAIDPEEAAIGFLEAVEARGTAALAERAPVDDLSPADDSTEAGTGADGESIDERDVPDRDAIRDICTAQSFQRGVTYVEEGRVQEVTVEGCEVTATVRGSSDYRTTVDLAARGFDPWCSCPYSYAGECKHVVAVLLTVAERADELTESSDEQDGQSETATGPTDATAGIEQAVEDADAGDLRDFLRDVLATDPALAERFRATVGEPVEKAVTDYRREIGRAFDDAAGQRGIIEYDTHIEFGEYHDRATAYRERGSHEQALRIYRALAETIRENFGRIDDSGGYYGAELERAIDAYAACVSAAGFDFEIWQDHADYLFEQFESADFGFVRGDYADALQTVAGTTDQLDYLRSLLAPRVDALEDNADARADLWRSERRDRLSPEGRALLSTYLWVLGELDERDELRATLAQTYAEGQFYRRYADVLVADGEIDRAEEIIEEGLSRHSRDRALHQRAVEFYEGRDEDRRRDLLQTMFVRFEDWDAYDDLKETCSDEEWDTTLHTIKTQLGRLDAEQLIDLYIYEGERETALDRVLDSEDLAVLRQYREDVADIHPEAYFETYRDLLEPYLADKTGRNHYRTVIDHLRELDSLGCDDELAAFVEHLREKHSNRPAFLDELETAGF